LVADARAVVRVAQAAQPGRTSPEARQTWLEVVLVSAQVVPLAFRQVSLEQGQQMVPVWLEVQLVSAQVERLAFRQALPEQE
jgi:hypothetical protein